VQKDQGVMNKQCHATAGAALAIAAVLALPTSSFAQINVIISGGFSPAYREVLPTPSAPCFVEVTRRMS
jgi:hypothetical protein